MIRTFAKKIIAPCQNKMIAPSTVQELAQRAEVCTGLTTLEKPGKNKGERGQAVEKLLGLENGNDLTDVSDGDLKTTTLGQTIFITQLSHCLPEIIEQNVTFDESKVGRKIKNCLYVVYDKEKALMGKYLVSTESHPEHYEKLAEDYNHICRQIIEIYYRKQTLKTINGPNKILQIRTKASKNAKTNEYTPLLYKNHQLKDKYMAFYLRSSFSKHLVSNTAC